MARYSKEHRDRTRARLVETARSEFRRHGFDTLSIDRLTAAAGLTRGAFYVHFASKEALVEEVLQLESGLLRALRVAARASEPRAAAADAIDAYLRNDSDSLVQCPMVAHPMDALRAGPTRTSLYSDHVSHLVDALDQVLGDSHAAEALAVEIVGAAILGASTEPALAARLLAASRARIRARLVD